MSNTITCTTKILSTTVLDDLVLQHVEITSHGLFGDHESSCYYVATDPEGTNHSGFCIGAGEALARTKLLIVSGAITQAPAGSANEAEMASAIAHLDQHTYRDGGVMDRAVRAGAAAGILSPEWVIASGYISRNGLHEAK